VGEQRPRAAPPHPFHTNVVLESALCVTQSAPPPQIIALAGKAHWAHSNWMVSAGVHQPAAPHLHFSQPSALYISGPCLTNGHFSLRDPEICQMSVHALFQFDNEHRVRHRRQRHTSTGTSHNCRFALCLPPCLITDHHFSL